MKKPSLLASAASYAGPVYGLGFLFGAIRELLVVPRIGRTRAVAAEAPLMAIASYCNAHRVVAESAAPRSAEQRLAIGATALGMLLMLELLAVAARRRSLSSYLRSQRSPEGALFASLLCWFAVAPLTGSAQS